MVAPERLELPTDRLEGGYSIQLNYRALILIKSLITCSNNNRVLNKLRMVSFRLGDQPCLILTRTSNGIIANSPIVVGSHIEG